MKRKVTLCKQPPFVRLNKHFSFRTVAWVAIKCDVKQMLLRIFLGETIENDPINRFNMAAIKLYILTFSCNSHNYGLHD